MSYESEVIDAPSGAMAPLMSPAVDDDALTFLAAKLWFRPIRNENGGAMHVADRPAPGWKLMPVA